MAWLRDQLAEQDIISAFVDLEEVVNKRSRKRYVYARSFIFSLPEIGTCWLSYDLYVESQQNGASGEEADRMFN